MSGGLRITVGIPSLVAVVLLTACVYEPPAIPDPTTASPVTESPTIMAGTLWPPAPAAAEPLVGTIAIVDGCVALHSPDGGLLPIVWPIGTVNSVDDPSAVRMLNGSVHVGDDIAGATGWKTTAEQLPPDTVTGVEACTTAADTELVVIYTIRGMPTQE